MLVLGAASQISVTQESVVALLNNSLGVFQLLWLLYGANLFHELNFGLLHVFLKIEDEV